MREPTGLSERILLLYFRAFWMDDEEEDMRLMLRASHVMFILCVASFVIAMAFTPFLGTMLAVELVVALTGSRILYVMPFTNAGEDSLDME